MVMFILQPFKVVSRTYAVNWKMVERWALENEGAHGLWDVMDGAQWQSNANPPAFIFSRSKSYVQQASRYSQGHCPPMQALLCHGSS